MNFSSLCTVFWEQTATLLVLPRARDLTENLLLHRLLFKATARSLLPHGVFTVCHRTGCLTIIFTTGCRGTSALLLEHLLPFLFLSPGCGRAVSHVSLTLTAVQLCVPRGAATMAEWCHEMGGSELAGTVCV